MDEATSRAWRKSSYSQQGDCVEWCFVDGTIRIRDSHDTEGPVLIFTRAEWQAFLGSVKAGEADLPG